MTNIVKHKSTELSRAITNVLTSKSNGNPVRVMASGCEEKAFGIMMYGICASVGISNAPEPIVINKIENATLDYFADFTDKEVMLAYDLAAMGTLDLGRRGFNVFEMNLKSHCDILRAYRAYRAAKVPKNQLEAKTYSKKAKFIIMGTGIIDDWNALNEYSPIRDLNSVKSIFLCGISSLKIDLEKGKREAVKAVDLNMLDEKNKALSIGNMLEKTSLAQKMSYFDFRVEKYQRLTQYAEFLKRMTLKELKSLLNKELNNLI